MEARMRATSAPCQREWRRVQPKGVGDVSGGIGRRAAEGGSSGAFLGAGLREGSRTGLRIGLRSWSSNVADLVEFGCGGFFRGECAEDEVFGGAVEGAVEEISGELLLGLLFCSLGRAAPQVTWERKRSLRSRRPFSAMTCICLRTVV